MQEFLKSRFLSRKSYVRNALPMKKPALFFLLLLFLTSRSSAQLNYAAMNVSYVAGTYTDLGASGTAVTTNFNGNPMTYDDDNSSIQNIGFNFTFNGTVFTQFVLCTNGFIRLGTTAPSTTTYSVLNSSEINIVSPFNYDLNAGASTPEYRVHTSGAVGSRVCTIQYKNLREWEGPPAQYGNISFQIKLYETSNNIEFVYGSFIASANTTATIQVTTGIKGSTAAKSVNVTKAGSALWTTSQFIDGNYTGNKFNNRKSVLPVSGTIFRFVAAPLVDAQVSEVYTLGKIPVVYGIPHTIRAKVVNNGASALTNIPVNLLITGANSFSNTKQVTVAAFSSAVVTFDPFSPTVIGKNSIAVSVSSDQIPNNNTGYYLQLTNANTYSYADESIPTGSIGFGTGSGIMLTKYHITGSTTVTGVNVYLSSSANVGNTIYAVVLNAAGTIVGQSSNYVTLAGDLDKYKNFTITTPPSLNNTDFYVGLAQTANATTAYYPLAVQSEETPTRSGAYYYTSLAGGIPTESTNLGRYMIQAVLNATVSPSSDPYNNTYWAWMKGDSVVDVKGVYGSLGVASANNKPGARSSGVSWTDTTGNLWMFGGSGFSNSTEGLLNDLWKYNITNNQWTWIKGDSSRDKLGVYGTQGVAASTNRPGARYESVSWKDNSGNFWLFGGAGYANSYNNNEPVLLNDLWKYNTLTNQWTWIKGDSNKVGYNVGVYGTLGSPAATNKPGARVRSVSWTDNAGNLWLFGGFGNAQTQYGELNDLWKFDISTNEWTWIKGDSIIEVNGIYGTMGTAATTNKPGSREGSVGWKDFDNNLWLFGGNGYSNSGQFGGGLNDLWKYNIGTNQWTWMKGDSIQFVDPVYGTKGIEAASNKPGSREGSVSWIDKLGNLWLFGGEARWIETEYNELWRYNRSNNQWTWVKGNSTGEGIYGVQGVEAAANTPGGRFTSMPWFDDAGNLWLFGGYSDAEPGYFNDMWRIYAGSSYIFTGDGDWDVAENWINNLIGPKNIPGGVSVTIDNFPPGQCEVINSINIQASGKLTIQPNKRLNIINGNLTNSGLLNGFGTATFTGSATGLSSPGFITAPLILSNKEVFLTGTTNTKSIELLEGSHITLGTYDLKMDDGNLVADEENYFITDNTGRLNRLVTSTPVEFPVGFSNTTYNPATITNTGTSDHFSVRVAEGVTTTGRIQEPVTTKNVNRTWYIVDDVAGGSTATLKLQWNLLDEQPLFDRTQSYIAHYQVCPPPPPPNCDAGFYDAIAVSAAAGNNPYTQERTNVTSFNTPSFIVTSQEALYTFINVYGSTPGDGLWSNPQNWTNAIKPPTVLGPGVHVVIDPIIGNECIYNGTLLVQPGGKITVKEGKKLTVIQ